MKNGVNIAGVVKSRTRSETSPSKRSCSTAAPRPGTRGACSTPASGRSPWAPPAWVVTSGSTARPGLGRRARRRPWSLLTPAEMFLVGAGAFLLTTIVLGSSSKGHTLMEGHLLMARAEPGQAWAAE